MGKIIVVLPDELETRLRQHIKKKFKIRDTGKRQGFLSYTVSGAIEYYLKSQGGKEE